MYAAYVGHDTVVNLLLDAGADAAKGTPDGLTPLMVAAGCGNESVCYFLLHVSTHSSLSLVITLSTHSIAPSRYCLFLPLLQNGAEIDAQDAHGYTALCHAVRQGHHTVVQLLLEAGADIELR